MRVLNEGPDAVAELQRELNALCGLVRFARERCYPLTLVARLERLLADTAAAAERARLEVA